jgi:hypothetical protein
MFLFIIFLTNIYSMQYVHDIKKHIVLLFICYVIHYIEIMVAVQTLKGNEFIAHLCRECPRVG